MANKVVITMHGEPDNKVVTHDDVIEVFVNTANAREIYDALKHQFLFEDAAKAAREWLLFFRTDIEDVPNMDSDEWDAVYEELVSVSGFSHRTIVNTSESIAWDWTLENVLPKLLFGKYLTALGELDCDKAVINKVRDEFANASDTKRAYEPADKTCINMLDLKLLCLKDEARLYSYIQFNDHERFDWLPLKTVYDRLTAAMNA